MGLSAMASNLSFPWDPLPPSFRYGDVFDTVIGASLRFGARGSLVKIILF